VVATAVFETRALTPWPGEVVQNLGEMTVVLVAGGGGASDVSDYMEVKYHILARANLSHRPRSALQQTAQRLLSSSPAWDSGMSTDWV